MAKLSILIPARNEEFLQRTIEDIFEHIEGDTEVIIGLDGWDGDVHALPSPRGDRLKYHGYKKAIGQRAMTNLLAQQSEAKYLMKVDAHCSFSQGFDVKMMEAMDDNTLMIPRTLNLHAYDWICAEHGRNYQGLPCCKEAKKMEIWQVKPRPIIDGFYFGKDMICQFDERPKEGDLVETMCVQGSAWMCPREKYYEWELGDENYGSWGSQGVEIGCKVWLSGGRVVANRNVFYAHLFRRHEEFPYERDMAEVDKTYQYHKDLFLNDKWPKAKHKLSWLVEKFEFPLDWQSMV